MTRKKFAVILFALLFVFIACSGLLMALPARAQASEETPEEMVEPTGLYTVVTVSIVGENSRVKATATYKYSIFDSTVSIKLYLYSSATYLSSYRGMRLDGTASHSKLPKYDSISCDAPTKGESRYWCARIIYTIDGGDQEELCTDVVHIDGAGNLIND